MTMEDIWMILSATSGEEVFSSDDWILVLLAGILATGALVLLADIVAEDVDDLSVQVRMNKIITNSEYIGKLNLLNQSCQFYFH